MFTNVQNREVFFFLQLGNVYTFFIHVSKASWINIYLELMLSVQHLHIYGMLVEQ